MRTSLLLPAALAALAGCAGPDNSHGQAGVDAIAAAMPAPPGTRATLALLETTDLHGNVLSYDYSKLAADDSLGFEKTATLVRAARAEFPKGMVGGQEQDRGAGPPDPERGQVRRPFRP